MAKFLYGNDYRTVIGAETSLGSGKTNATSIAWTEVTVLPDKCEMTLDKAQIDTGAKTQTGLPTLCEIKSGYEKYTVTLSGVLSNEHEILLQAFFKDAGTPYTMDSVPTLDGYLIMQVWADDTGTPYTADKAVGCQCMSLKFTGASGGMVTYEAVFMARSYVRRDATVAITGTDPGTVCTEGFNFGDVTADLIYGDTTHLKSFDLTLNNNLVDDAAMFQNSNTILQAIPSTVSGELNYVTNYYDTADDIGADTKINANSSIIEKIILVNTNKTWEIIVTGQLTGFTRADPDDGIYDSNVTHRLVYDVTSGDYPIAIAIT